MIFFSRRSRGGLIKSVLLIIGGVLILSYLGIDLQNNAASPLIKKNFLYVWNGAETLWTNHLREPIVAVINWAAAFFAKK
ncbi:MAG: hypothetical protein A3A22_03735 [Candidatus Taylorbacteria bacterium RIFCSPLOWO2_01_FULL_45_34b]|nr:MAG: hypothetical protein A3A22_03735 [Candidatus Taylorbacteria bacterium RIFCSPLOWO2_01_FULL_45_34b]